MNFRSRIRKTFLSCKKLIDRWTKNHLSGLFIFNLVVIVMVLLSNAGYFHPFFYLTINLISFVSLALSILLLGANSKSMFLISAFFLVFSGFLTYFQINIWAERSGIYVFQSFFLGILLLMFKKE